MRLGILLFTLWVAAIAKTVSVSTFQTQENGVLRWSAQIAEAEALLPTPRSYRVFEALSTIPLTLPLFNESATPIAFEMSTAAGAVDFRVLGVTPVPVRAELQLLRRRSIAGDAETITQLQRVLVQPNTGVVLQFQLHRSDEQRFQPGTYQIHVSIARVLSQFTDGDGNPWKGVAPAETVLQLAIAPPDRPQDLASMYRVRGLNAFAAGQHDVALEWFAKAVGADPSNIENLGELGNTYLRLNRYREAIAVYEQLLPRVLGAHTLVPSHLAYAYVAIDDVPNAERVLRDAGQSAESIAREIEQFRAIVKKRQR